MCRGVSVMASTIPTRFGTLLACSRDVAWRLPEHGILPDLVVNLSCVPVRGPLTCSIAIARCDIVCKRIIDDLASRLIDVSSMVTPHFKRCATSTILSMMACDALLRRYGHAPGENRLRGCLHTWVNVNDPRSRQKFLHSALCQAVDKLDEKGIVVVHCLLGIHRTGACCAVVMDHTFRTSFLRFWGREAQRGSGSLVDAQGQVSHAKLVSVAEFGRVGQVS